MHLSSILQRGKPNNEDTDEAMSLKLVDKTFPDKGVRAFHRWMQLAIWQIE